MRLGAHPLERNFFPVLRLQVRDGIASVRIAEGIGLHCDTARPRQRIMEKQDAARFAACVHAAGDTHRRLGRKLSRFGARSADGITRLRQSGRHARTG